MGTLSSAFALKLRLFELGWHAASRESGTNKPVADPTRFPNGVKHLADSVHNLGLKVRPVLFIHTT